MATQRWTPEQLAAWAQQKAVDLSSRKGYPRLLKALRTQATASAKEGFATSSDPDNVTWAPLAHARPRGGNKVLRDTGILQSSVHTAITETGLIQSSNLIQAPLHQYGGTVKPKRAKALAIPLTVEAVRTGGASHFPRDLFIIRGKRHSFLAEARQKGKGKRARTELIFHYILLNSVTIPARRFVGFGKRFFDRAGPIIRNWAGGEFTVSAG